MEKINDKSQQPNTLTEEELLARFVSRKGAGNLIREYDSLYTIMAHTSDRQIGAVSGIGKSGLNKLLCMKEVMNRMQRDREKTVQSVPGPDEAAACFQFLEDKEQEELWVLLLTCKNTIIKKQRISLGTVNESLAMPREVFHAAVQNMARSVILAHNHPSGDSSPSLDDECATKKMIEAGNLLGISVLDHIIIGKQGSCSMKFNNPELWKSSEDSD